MPRNSKVRNELARMRNLGLPKYYGSLEMSDDLRPSEVGRITYDEEGRGNIKLKPNNPRVRNALRHELGHAANHRIAQQSSTHPNDAYWTVKNLGPLRKREFASRSQEMPASKNSYPGFFGRSPEEDSWKYTPTENWYAIGPDGFRRYSPAQAESLGFMSPESRFAMPTMEEVQRRNPNTARKSMARHRAYQTLTPAQQTLALRGGYDPEFSNPYRGHELTQGAQQWEQSPQAMRNMVQEIQQLLKPYATGNFATAEGPTLPNPEVVDILNTYAITPQFDPSKNTYDRMSYSQMADVYGRLRNAQKRRISHSPWSNQQTSSKPGSSQWYNQQDYLRSLEDKGGTVKPLKYEDYASYDPVDPVTQQALNGNRWAQFMATHTPTKSRPTPESAKLPDSIELKPPVEAAQAYTGPMATYTYKGNNGSRVTYRVPAAQQRPIQPTPRTTQQPTQQRPIQPAPRTTQTPHTAQPTTPQRAPSATQKAVQAPQTTQQPTQQKPQQPAYQTPRLFRRRRFRRW